MSEKELIEISQKNLKLDVTKEILEKLKKYCDFLLEYNQHTNLTAIKTPELVYLKHFYDSLTIHKAIEFQKNQKVLDIGTGAGFPGIIIAIMNPCVEVHLLDSNHKKIRSSKCKNNIRKIRRICQRSYRRIRYNYFKSGCRIKNTN